MIDQVMDHPAEASVNGIYELDIMEATRKQSGSSPEPLLWHHQLSCMSKSCLMKATRSTTAHHLDLSYKVQAGKQYSWLGPGLLEHLSRQEGVRPL